MSETQMPSIGHGPHTRPRWRSHGPLLCVLLAGLVGVVVASSSLQAWREREREARLRRIRTTAGMVDEHPAFRSARLGNTRSVAVCLPRQYLTEPDRRFPVLYVQDGQDAFDGATATVAGQEWQLDETAERLIVAERIEPLIVVAIGSDDTRRTYEYTPSRGPAGGGGADDYGRMLVEELKPWIDGRYRTLPGRESTGIAGSSLGGLVALYVGLRHPAVFSRIASLSTAACWDDGFVARFVDALPTKPATSIWTDVGEREDPSSLACARLLRDALVRKGWREGGDMRYLEAEGGRHDEASWAQRLPEMLEFLFPPAGSPPPASR